MSKGFATRSLFLAGLHVGIFVAHLDFNRCHETPIKIQVSYKTPAALLKRETYKKPVANPLDIKFQVTSKSKCMF